jgi:hypothetical protein
VSPMQVGEQVWRVLEPPRPLSDAERALVEYLAPGDASGVVVSGECRCGCPSVRLATVRFSGSHSQVTALGTLPDGGLLQVLLHRMDGVMTELEVFAGEGVAVALPAPADLSTPQPA